MILKGLSLKDSFSEIEVHGQFSPPVIHFLFIMDHICMFIKIKQVYVNI